MLTIDDVAAFLEQFAPSELAEDWDNVGLLVGSRQRELSRLMTCLTVTPDSAREAIDQGAQLIVTHHPLPFRPLKRLTDETVPGRLLLELIRAGIAVYSPHTAFDSAAAGINQRLAEGLQLSGIQPLVPLALASQPHGPADLGSGRYGELAQPTPLQDVAQQLKQLVDVQGLHRVGSPQQPIRRVAVACGSAGQFLSPARQAGCDLLVTGETSFHTCLEAEATGVALLLPGHYASERFAVEQLAQVLQKHFPQLQVWPSRSERDPLAWM